jgi:putative acetyltransferase
MYRIELETDRYREEIREVQYTAFKGHPYHEPGAEPTEHKIVDELRNHGALSLSLVTFEGNKVVGQVAFSPVKINKRNKNWYGLGPVAALPAFQKRGIGTALIGEGIKRLKSQGADGIVVLGEPEYYRRFGFRHKYGLTLADVPADYFQALAFSSEIPEGEVLYHPAFIA